MTNNINQFMRLLKSNRAVAMNEMGKVGVKNIKKITPVDRGDLQEANEYDIVDDCIYFKNDKDYAPPVELGTYKMAARPFMRNGIINSRGEFMTILLRRLDV